MDQLVNHRVLNLDQQQIAVISEESNGWFLSSESDYKRISNAITRQQQLPELLREDLYQAGLLSIAGNTVAGSVKKKKDAPISLLLKLTGACNIHCDYCYDYDLKRWKSRLSFDKIKSAIQHMRRGNEAFVIAFHGGEPLLRFDMIRQTVDYVRSQKLNEVAFSIQTNAALLNDEIVSFLEKHNFTVGLSIDGHTESANRLRSTASRVTALDHFMNALRRFPEFVRERCGVLTVVSKANVSELPAFACWLEQQGINGLGFSFMDKAGKGTNIPHEKITVADAIRLFEGLFEKIESGEIRKLNVSTLISKISNIYQFAPKDFCHKGPCAAYDEFLVLDAEDNYRTCDSVYHPFFMIGSEIGTAEEIAARNNILDRYEWIKNESLNCSSCPILSFCGGTCVAKAIASNKDPYSVDSIECALSKLIYPKVLTEFRQPEKSSLLRYFYSHTS